MKGNTGSALLNSTLPPSAEMMVAIAPWCSCMTKRLVDVLGAAALVIAASPLMALIALMVKSTSPGPVLFRQSRVGQGEAIFKLFKFRTMIRSRAESGPGVTAKGDSRVTAVGRILRRWKLDELPQLFNVLRGEMSLVGPRPDLARYLERVSPEERSVLLVKPGITSAATIAFRNEEQLLSTVPKHELEEFYCSTLLRRKIQMELHYASNATFLSDLGVLLWTAKIVLFADKSDSAILKDETQTVRSQD